MRFPSALRFLAAGLVAALLPGPASAGTSVGPRRSLLVDGQPFHPVCLYHARWAEAAALGFNCVIPGTVPDPEEVAAGLAGGVRHIAEYSDFVRRGDLAALRAAAERLRDAPILASYVVDEPHYARLAPAAVAAAARVLKEAAPNHPTLVVDERDAVTAYARTADVIGLDHYPVRWTGYRYGFPGRTTDSLESVGRYVDKAVRAAGAERPVWFALQAHRIPSDAAYPDSARWPTPEEVRAMAYLALNHGATGILVYAYADDHQGIKGFKFNPALAAAVGALASELRAVLPAYTHGEVTPLPAEGPVDAVRIAYAGTLRVVVVNQSGRPAPVGLPGLGRRVLAPLEVVIAP